MEQLEIDRNRTRWILCRRELARAKRDLTFWSAELAHVSDVLALQDQFCFEFFERNFKEEN